MPVFCAAFGCNNRRSIQSRSRGITFHKFPSNTGLRRQWEVALRRVGFAASESSKLCSEHFKPEDFDRTGQIVRLRDGVTPSVFNFPSRRHRSVAKRSKNTSKKAVKSVSQCFPESVPQLNNEHSYALPSLATHLSEALGVVESGKQEKQNEEQKAKATVKSLLEDLKRRNLINEELKEKLDFHSDLQIDLFSKRGHEYTKDQREFALTLHLHGPKAYSYLRDSLHLPLPHPHTLQSADHKMDPFAVFRHLQFFLEKGTFPKDVDFHSRKKIKRMSPHFLVKDNRLFYVGPSQKFMRLVVMSEREKTSSLTECHNNPATGNHNGMRTTRDRVTAGYYWLSITKDVDDWVKHCHRCQPKEPIKTVAPVRQSIKVKEPWEVLGLDLIGPLPETSLGNKYVLTMTDLFTKWVVAEPLRSKTVAEVSSAIISKLYTFGLVRKIITDQGKEFVDQLNDSIFKLLNIQHAVSSEYHTQTSGQDERTNENIKRALTKYIAESHNDWDLHLPAVVYGNNTAKQSSTKYTPYFLLFHRHPRLPEVMNACPMGDSFEVDNAEEGVDNQLSEIQNLNAKVLQNIERPQER